MIAEAIETNKVDGWLPKSLDVSKLDYPHYLFDVTIYDEGDDFVSIQCWTKWSPPIIELEHIGKEMQINITCIYEELGCELYGQSEYDFENDCTNIIELDQNDFARVQYDDENDTYSFDGVEIESDNIAYAEMLDNKLQMK